MLSTAGWSPAIKSFCCPRSPDCPHRNGPPVPAHGNMLPGQTLPCFPACQTSPVSLLHALSSPGPDGPLPCLYRRGHLRSPSSLPRLSASRRSAQESVCPRPWSRRGLRRFPSVLWSALPGPEPSGSTPAISSHPALSTEGPRHKKQAGANRAGSCHFSAGTRPRPSPQPGSPRSMPRTAEPAPLQVRIPLLHIPVVFSYSFYSSPISRFLSNWVFRDITSRNITS